MASQSDLPGRSKWLVVICLAVALVAAAWTLANWGSMRWAEDAEQVLSDPLGPAFLCRGALPWILQWAGLAFLWIGIARGRLRANSAAVVLGVLFPLLIGLTWWIGFCATFWTSDPADLLFEAAAHSTAGDYATFWQKMLLDVFGPLAHPLGQRPPFTLAGWDFLWTGLSTGLVMSSLTLVARTGKTGSAGSAKPSRGRILLQVVWVLVYFGPVFLRLTLQVVHAL